MTLGVPPDSPTINAEITAAAALMRDANTAAQRIAAKINKLGLTGLQGLPTPFTAEDAQAALDLAGQFINVSGVYFGTQTQAAAYNYDDRFTPLYP